MCCHTAKPAAPASTQPHTLYLDWSRVQLLMITLVDHKICDQNAPHAQAWRSVPSWCASGACLCRRHCACACSFQCALPGSRAPHSSCTPFEHTHLFRAHVPAAACHRLQCAAEQAGHAAQPPVLEPPTVTSPCKCWHTTTQPAKTHACLARPGIAASTTAASVRCEVPYGDAPVMPHSVPR